MQNIKIAVIGCGFWGMKILEGYHKLLDEGKINGLVACDNDEKRLAKVTEKYKDVNVTKDYKEITDFGVTCAHILVPNNLPSISLIQDLLT